MSTRHSIGAGVSNGVRWHLYRELAEDGEPLMLLLQTGAATLEWRVPEDAIECLLDAEGT